MFYEWGKRILRRVDFKNRDILKSDLEKQPEIDTDLKNRLEISHLSKFAKLHARFLKGKKKHG